jgi:hypothetical protein
MICGVGFLRGFGETLVRRRSDSLEAAACVRFLRIPAEDGLDELRNFSPSNVCKGLGSDHL